MGKYQGGYQDPSRRKFIKQTTVSTLGLTLGGNLLTNCSSQKLANLAVQLYTVRREIATDLTGTLRKLVDIGFTAVETAFWPDHISLKQGAEALKNAGLEVCSIHCELPEEDEKSLWLDLANAYDCRTLIWHGWPEDPRYQSLDGIKELADVYNEAYAFAEAQGLRFGLHNHWWEFRNKVEGGYPFEILIEYINPNIFFEIDTYWVKVAGLDPAIVVGNLAHRAPYLHIKDGPARYTESLGKDEPEPMTAVGQGTQNFPQITKAANGHTQWMIVEMDVTKGDVFEALKDSYIYLTSHQLGLG